jgi:hypothetical protein
MMYGHEKSDRCVVPRKSSNKVEQSAAERVEGRHLVEGRPVGKARSEHTAGDRVPCVAWSGCVVAWLAQTLIDTTVDPRQEPGAGIPHAGICAGGVQQCASLPRQGRRVVLQPFISILAQPLRFSALHHFSKAMS